MPTRLTCPKCGSDLKLETRNCRGCMGVEERVRCKVCTLCAPWVPCCSDLYCTAKELAQRKRPSTKKRAYRAWKQMRKVMEASA